MPASFGILKGAIRSYSDGEYIHALLELKSLIERERDCWTAYLVKGKCNAALKRDYEAIADYGLVLEMAQSLNERNRRMVLQGLTLCANRLSEKQRYELNKYFKKGPPPRVKKRGVNTKVLGTSDAGKIASIGKFLFGPGDIEKIENMLQDENSKSPGVEKISMEAGQAFRTLLQKIDKHPSVIGSCIIGHDLFIRASTLPEEYDAEPFGINGVAFFLAAKEEDKLVEFYRDGHVLARCDLGHLVILEFNGVILVTLSDEKEVLKLVKLANKIAKIVR